MRRRSVLYALASVLSGITALAAAQPATAAEELATQGKIRNVATDSRWALDGNGGSLVDTLPRGHYTNYDSDRWDIETDLQGHTEIRNAKTNQCLDATTVAVDQFLHTAACSGSRTQQWDFESVGSGHYIISPRNRSDLVISVYDDSNPAYSFLWLKPRPYHHAHDSVFYIDQF